MKYEKPVMELLKLEAMDVITLSIGKDDYDPEIKGENGNNPWAN